MVTPGTGPNGSFRPETELYYQTRITALMNHIQQHIDEPLMLDELARIACFSPFHLHHIFTAFVGVPMAEYIRR